MRLEAEVISRSAHTTAITIKREDRISEQGTRAKELAYDPDDHQEGTIAEAVAQSV
jgi:hypothetical protein